MKGTNCEGPLRDSYVVQYVCSIHSHLSRLTNNLLRYNTLLLSFKIRSIKLTEFNSGMDPESNPSKIHLFVNRENLGFEDCEDVDPTQTLHLTTEDLKESAEPIQLKFVKYQRVKSLTLFIEDNQGGEITALGMMKIYGRPVASTNMADFKKQTEG
jgi:hypothetical protein